MSMKAMHELKEMLCKELDKISEKGDLSAGTLETAHKLTDTIKNIDKIMMLEEDGGYSERGDMMPYSQRRGYSRDGYSRDGDWEARGRFGHSYDEGGSSYAGRRRDAMGRYSRDDGKTALMGEMEAMMQRASGQDRETIRRAMDELQGA